MTKHGSLLSIKLIYISDNMTCSPGRHSKWGWSLATNGYVPPIIITDENNTLLAETTIDNDGFSSCHGSEILIFNDLRWLEDVYNGQIFRISIDVLNTTGDNNDGSIYTEVYSKAICKYS